MPQTKGQYFKEDALFYSVYLYLFYIVYALSAGPGLFLVQPARSGLANRQREPPFSLRLSLAVFWFWPLLVPGPSCTASFRLLVAKLVDFLLDLFCPGYFSLLLVLLAAGEICLSISNLCPPGFWSVVFPICKNEMHFISKGKHCL